MRKLPPGHELDDSRGSRNNRNTTSSYQMVNMDQLRQHEKVELSLGGEHCVGALATELQGNNQ